MSVAIQLLINTLIPAALFALLAAGFSLTYATTRAQNVAHGALAIAAGYLFFALTIGAGWNPIVSGIITVGAITCLGGCIHWGIFETLRARRGKSSSWAETIIASFGLLVLFQNTLLAIFGPQTQTFGTFRTTTVGILGATITSRQILTIAIAVALLAALGIFLKISKTGKALRATADNESVSEVIGINTRRMRVVAVLIASALAGVAGILFALEYNLEPNMPVAIAIKMYFRAIIGGIGSIPGAIFGSLLLQSAEELGTYFWKSAYKDLVAFSIAFVILLVRPSGLFGRREKT